MNTDFKNGKELLEFCEKEKISISRAMLLRESDQTEKTESSIYTRMETAWNIMKEAALSPISSPRKIHRRPHRRRSKTAESAF